MSAPVTVARAGRSARKEIVHDPRSRGYISLALIALTVFGVVPWILYATAYPIAIDARAYFLAQPGALYGGEWGTEGVFVYSPAFSQLIEPLRWLGWDGFRTTWRLLETGALAAMTGPFTGLFLFASPVALEVNIGNIHLLLAAAIVAGFRWPALWSFVLLTKVTPGVGLLWFVVRREWRSLAIAFGATAAIALVSFVVTPGDWLAWFRLLTTPATPEGHQLVVTLPLPIRFVLSGALVVWGARRDYRWTVLAAAFLALPVVWYAGLAMLVGLWWLRPRPSHHDRLRRRASAPAGAGDSDELHL